MMVPPEGSTDIGNLVRKRNHRETPHLILSRHERYKISLRKVVRSHHITSAQSVQDSLAIAIRSLKDRSVTIVSLTQVLVSCMVGVWLVELPSSSIMYWKVPRLIVKKTNRLTQAVVFFRRHFLCGALLCNCSPAEREVYLHICTTAMSAEPFMRSILSQRILTSLPGSRLLFFYRDANSVPTSTPFFYSSSINRLYAQNPVFKIVREESVEVYLHMHNENVQQNPPCVGSCVTKEISISPQLSPTMFDPDANSILLRAPLYRSRLYVQKTLCSKLFMMRAWRSIFFSSFFFISLI